MCNKKLLIFLLLGIAVMGYANMVANPVEAAPYKKLRLSGEFSHDVRIIDYKFANDVENESNRVMAKFSYSVYELPLIELYGKIGMADINFPSKPGYTNFNGSYELAFGCGGKIYITGVDIDDYGRYNMDFYSDLSFIMTRSSGEVNFGANLMSDTKYIWNEYQIGAYAVFNSVDWNIFHPYLGFNWFYINGTEDSKVFRYQNGEPNYFYSEKGFFNDPEQMPKIVAGFDIKFKKGFALSIETAFGFKRVTSICVGVSQLSGFNNEEKFPR